MKNKDHAKNSWLEIEIDADPETHEAISSILFDAGCSGVAGEDQRPGCLRAYIEAQKASAHQIELIRQRLEKIPLNFPGSRPPVMRTRFIENQDWSEKWKEFFGPERISAQLTIIPAWETPPSQSTPIIMLMDPGPAFGTGQHPSTKMCLMALEEVKRPDPWNMLDVGTGSGILAIYAALLGAQSVMAIDIDPEALRWAKRNARLNRVQDKILFDTIPLKRIPDQFCVVIANLIYDTILQLSEDLAAVTEKGGALILSGLLKEQVKPVLGVFQAMGLMPARVYHLEEWASVMLRKPAKK